MPDALDATVLLHQVTHGSPEAADRLMPLVYEELRGIAERLLRRERPDHTLQATELVHEAYLRLIDQTRCKWQNQAHFRAVASRAMRRILVDHARRHGSQKRGGGGGKVSLEEALTIGRSDTSTVLLALDIALQKLASQHPEIGAIVEMRFFGGLTHEECACVLGISERAVYRHWAFAQAWLYREMSDGVAGG